jgi:hypothetical protein
VSLRRAVTAPWRAWERFWFAPTGAEPLGAFRIAFGLIALAHLALLWPEADLWLSDRGYLRGAEAAQLAGPLRWSPLQTFQDPQAVRATLAATAAAAAAVVLGWHARLASLALYAGLLAVHHRNLLSSSGADALLVILALWLALSPSGAALSLDARRRAQRSTSPACPLISPWAQRMMQLQLALVYLATALMKAGGPTWANGSALHYVLHQREIRRWTFGLEHSPELVNLLTFGALFLEFALPFGLWFRPVRPWLVAAGLLLHGGIALTVNIPLFGELMTACYLLFLSPAEMNTLLRVLRISRDERTSTPAPPASALNPPHVLDRARATR